LGKRLLVQTVDGTYLFARRVVPPLINNEASGRLRWVDADSIPLRQEVVRWCDPVSLDEIE
jgi:hypothetical protein